MKRYLIRLDDACPTMNHKKWNRVFTILNQYDIKPIVAVIPNNKDKSMMIDNPNENFWEEMRTLQSSGYMLALHGETHEYTTTNRGIIPMNEQSEFTGLDLDLQRKKIKSGYEYLQKKGLNISIWVAPSHSFDKNTLKALKEETAIDIISDGLAFYPYREEGFFWIPQQTWGFRKRAYGVWTICLHPNSMTEEKFQALEKFVSQEALYFINDITSLKSSYQNRKKSLLDRLYFKYFFKKRHKVQNRRKEQGMV